MEENKTVPTRESAVKFITAIKDKALRDDCLKIAIIMQKATGEKPAMWGTSIVGFGNVHYIYTSGREGDWMKTGFSPGKNKITVYVMPGLDDYEAELKTLGKFNRGKGCIYIRRLADIDVKVLSKIINTSVEKLNSGVFRA